MSDHDLPLSSVESGADAIAIDCGTCLAANTTACGDCIVTHLLANDAGPIELVVADRPAPVDAVERAIDLLVAAGLCDDPPAEVSADEFDAFDESGARPVPVH
ncbi:MAG: hypothetical protein AAF945_03515 [Actinomycetota bacterium]